MSPERPEDNAMRFYYAFALLACVTLSAAPAQEPKSLDRQVSEALRDVHDQGRELYNAGDTGSCYRMFQGGLLMARGLLGNRPDLQKAIADGMAAAEREPVVGKRAFMLHELIEKVRADLRTGGKKPPESIGIPPREVKPESKPMAKVGEVKSGVVGRVLWQGKPVAGVDVTFVSLGRTPPKVYESATGSQGVYTVPDILPGKYVVLITPGAKAEVKKLPERYATSTTSPLVFDIKGGGEKLDFVLQ